MKPYADLGHTDVANLGVFFLYVVVVVVQDSHMCPCEKQSMQIIQFNASSDVGI